MGPTETSNMEEISLDDEDVNSMEFKVLVALVQCRQSGRLTCTAEKGHRKDSSNEDRSEFRTDSAKEQTGLSTSGPGNSSACMEEEHTKSGSVGKAASKKNKKKQKKKSWKLKLFPKCIQGLTDDQEDIPKKSRNVSNKGPQPIDKSTEATTNDAAARQIAKKILDILHMSTQRPHCFRSHCLETDGIEGEEQLIEKIVALLRDSGDALNEKIKKDVELHQSLSSKLNYSCFKKITDMYLDDFASPGVEETKQQKIKIASAADVAVRLSAIDTHPMNKVMSFGSRYLKEHFTPWIQNQGGWEKALDMEEGATEDEVD
ncbi:apoptosis facilitator Bcl-2-like protein 14 isoform X2 [Protopterus annectens]|nr:apoptosis facilitator Bcl-2-like protein 14 isoform X2 [Protopterus annectens]XP_043944063.1 apoptosis facilitator Bcl-2-like protein 14 isoform X2 [Protopterus annectens]